MAGVTSSVSSFLLSKTQTQFAIDDVPATVHRHAIGYETADHRALGARTVCHLWPCTDPVDVRRGDDSSRRRRQFHRTTSQTRILRRKGHIDGAGLARAIGIGRAISGAIARTRISKVKIRSAHRQRHRDCWNRCPASALHSWRTWSGHRHELPLTPAVPATRASYRGNAPAK